MAQLLVIFVTIFLAELGDKTQLATLLLASKGEHSRVLVFVAASAALCLSTGIAVFLGSMARHYMADFPIRLVAGIGFVAIGAWTIIEHFRSG